MDSSMAGLGCRIDIEVLGNQGGYLPNISVRHGFWLEIIIFVALGSTKSSEMSGIV